MAKLVEVLPVCSVDQQRQALALLPEVAGEEDHAAVLDCLEGVLQEEASLVPAALEALANLSLDPDMQARGRAGGDSDGGDRLALVSCVHRACPPADSTPAPRPGGAAAGPGGGPGPVPVPGRQCG